MLRSLFFAALALAPMALLAVESMLDNGPRFKPQILFTEGYGEKILNTTTTDATTGEVTRGREINDRSRAYVQIVASMRGIDLSEVSDAMQIGVTIGGFTHASRLGGATEWDEDNGSGSADFQLTEVVNEDGTPVDPDDPDDPDAPGDTPAPTQRVNRKGSVKYKWDQKYLLIRIKGQDIGGIVAEAKKGEADDEMVNGLGTAKFAEAIDCTVTFGSHGGARKVYAKGVVQVIERVFFTPNEVAGAAPTEQSFDVHKVLAVGSADRNSPVLTFISAKAGLLGYRLVGTLGDQKSVPKIDRIVVQRKDAPEPAITLTGDDIELNSIGGNERFLQWESTVTLSEKARYLVQVFASDESGNRSSAERTIVTFEKPTKPEGLLVTAVLPEDGKPKRIRVQYQPATNATRYLIEVKGAPNQSTTGFVQADSTTTTDELVGEGPEVDADDALVFQTGNVLTIRVRAFGPGGPSGYSDEAMVTVL